MRWRLQTILLTDQIFGEFVERCIDKYYERNESENKASIMWKAFKAHSYP